MYMDVTIAGEGLQFCLCSVLTTFEQWGIFIVPITRDLGFHGLTHNTSMYSHLIRQPKELGAYSKSDPHGIPIWGKCIQHDLNHYISNKRIFGARFKNIHQNLQILNSFFSINLISNWFEFHRSCSRFVISRC